jgi:DNA-binding NtrC family response regulator
MEHVAVAVPFVLVVEDEAMIRLVLVEGLEDAGFSVAQAESADAAVALLADGAPALAVVTDVRMPGSMDGLGLAAWMREHRPMVPVFITSGYATPPNAGMLNPAIAAVVPKPYKLGELVALVASRV